MNPLQRCQDEDLYLITTFGNFCYIGLGLSEELIGRIWADNCT